MSQKNLINNELMISGSGDACTTANTLCQPENQIILEKNTKSKCSKPSAYMNSAKLTTTTTTATTATKTTTTAKTPQVLSKKNSKSTEKVRKGSEQITNLKRCELRRALTLNDMNLPQSSERLEIKSYYTNVTSNMDKKDILGKQLVMSKLLSTLYYQLWKKKKIISGELKEQVKQLLIQKSFLNEMRVKESKKRDELSKLTAHLYKTIAECESQVLQLKEEKDSLILTLNNMSNNLAELHLDLEKSEFIKTKLQKINNEHLEHMHRVNEELANLKLENKDQKQKIIYMNNVADQQDYNLKQLHRIAEDLDTNLKEKIEYARSVLRRRDEAIEQEEQATFRSQMLEACLKESKDTETQLRSDMNQLKDVVDESEKRKLLITLENVDLKYKLESTEILLSNALAQVKQFEVQAELAAATKSIFCDIRRKVWRLVPWHNLFQLGMHFFPVIANSQTIL